MGHPGAFYAVTRREYLVAMAEQETVTLSRGRLASFLNCQRQYQLRFVERVAWPEAPLPDEIAAMVAHGQRFHQLLERHFLGLPVQPEDDTLRIWWNRFKDSALSWPNGRFIPETSLTIPIALPTPARKAYLLNGRFDLLCISTENGTPSAHIFDWKTGKPLDVPTLRRDWQTRLYLALVAEGGSALRLSSNRPISPENISLTYWYVDEPDAPRTIRYSTALHQENWTQLQAIVQQLDALEDDVIWPLTDDWTTCRTCAYQIICGRQAAGTALPQLPDEDTEHLFDDLDLEPDTP